MGRGGPTVVPGVDIFPVCDLLIHRSTEYVVQLENANNMNTGGWGGGVINSAKLMVKQEKKLDFAFVFCLCSVGHGNVLLHGAIQNN